MRVWAMAIMLSLLLCACTLQVGGDSSNVNLLSGGEGKLARTKKVLLATPSDIVLAGKPEAKSGDKTLKAMTKALRTQNVTFAQTNHSAQDALLAEAGRVNAGYVLTMKITFWDDPPSFLQQRPDKGQVRLEVFDAENGQRLRTDSVECQKFPTLVNHIGTGDPGDCLEKGFEEWLGKAFQ